MSLSRILLLLNVAIQNTDLSIYAHLSMATIDEALQNVCSSVVVLVCILEL